MSDFFQAMKGEKGIPGVSVGDNLGEELTDDSFSKNSAFHILLMTPLFSLLSDKLRADGSRD